MPHQNNYFYFVNRSYYIANLLSERLEELNGQHNDSVLAEIFNHTIIALKGQVNIARDKIIAIGETDSLSLAQPAINLLESIFNNILQPGCDIQYIHLYDYLNVADCMMTQTTSLTDIAGKQITANGYYSDNIYDVNALTPALNFLKENLFTAATT